MWETKLYSARSVQGPFVSGPPAQLGTVPRGGKGGQVLSNCWLLRSEGSEPCLRGDWVRLTLGTRRRSERGSLGPQHRRRIFRCRRHSRLRGACEERCHGIPMSREWLGQKSRCFPDRNSGNRRDTPAMSHPKDRGTSCRLWTISSL